MSSQAKQDDPRLAAAALTLEEFVGRVECAGNPSMSDGLLLPYKDESNWATLPEVALLEPQSGYSLRCNIPADSHKVFLLHKGAVVGVFVETDSVVVHSDHQQKGLGPELILAAFAQKSWRTPARKVSPAGKKAFERAYDLACRVQQSLHLDDHASG